MGKGFEEVIYEDRSIRVGLERSVVVSSELRTGVTNHPSVGIEGSNVSGETLRKGRAIVLCRQRY